MDCRLTFSNPPDYIWGVVSEDELSGSYKEIREERVDIVAGCHMITNERDQARLNLKSVVGGQMIRFGFLQFQVAVGSYPHDYVMITSMASISPKPIRYLLLHAEKKAIFISHIIIVTLSSSVFILLRAFDATTWGLILAFLLTFPLILAAVTKMEEKFSGKPMYWGNLLNSYWYVFGVFLGETMISSDRALNAVRYR